MRLRRGPALPFSTPACTRPPSPRPASHPLQAHFESKHPTLTWDESKATDLHAQAGGVTTQGVAVRGSKKK
jgi:hypothetical protein